MASLTGIDAPGAYPATPLNEEPTRQTQRDQVHQQGLGNDIEHNVPIGRNINDSGSHGAESSLSRDTNHPALAHRSQPQHTPRTVATETQSGVRGSSNLAGTGTKEDSTSRGIESQGPGVMTGAYSRVGNQDSTIPQSGNYTYGNEPAPRSTVDRHSQNHLETGVADTTTNALTPVNTPAESARLDRNRSGAVKDTTSHSTAQSNVHRTSQEKHKDPYWGDIPFGTGIYNGVTGHGSNESPTAHKRPSTEENEHDAARNTGIYNGVTGHGSGEFDNRRTEGQDRDAVLGGTHGQREFPLVSDSTTGAGAQQRGNQPEPGRDSHFKEVLAGTGATAAAGGYAAHKHHDDKKASSKEARVADESVENEKSEEHGRKKFALPIHSLRHKDERISDNKNEERQRRSNPMMMAAKPAAAEPRTETDLRANQPSTLGDEKMRKQEKDSSNAGYYGAGAAAAAAGAGAYGAHEYSKHRDVERNDVPERDNVVPSSGTSSNYSNNTQNTNTREPALTNAQLGNEATPGHTMHQNTPSSMLPTSGAKQPDQLAHHSGLAHEGHGLRRSGAAEAEASDVKVGGAHSPEELRANPSLGGQYNMLSSGTPSGINLEQGKTTTKEGQGQGHSKFLSNAH
ncbi:hypothetical protein F4777DRAFT_597451 [Nemania sp. FL0916]|nr:hypothetical protein F4777DRAFT_597451 [Nemania sp. FL0916]